MKKKLLTYLIPIVLVIGTAFGAGLVVGDNDDCTADTNVDIEVEYVPPELDLCSSYIHCQPIDNGHEQPFDQECDEDVKIMNMKVYSPHHEEVEVYLEIESEEYGDGEEGDAVRYKEIEDTITVEEGDYTDGVAYFHYNSVPGEGFNLGEEPFWVAGLWTLRGHLYVDGAEVDGSEDEKEGFFEVNKCCDLVATETLPTSDETYEPGEYAEFEEGTVTLSANFAWELSAEDFKVFETDDGVVEYLDPVTGNPAEDHEVAFTVDDIFIPWGTEGDDTYSGTMTHTLSQE